MTGRTNGGTTTSYTWAGGDQNELVSTVAGSDTIAFVYGRTGQNGVPMLESFTKNGVTSYIDTDPTGAPVALTTGSGVDYYALDNQRTPVNLINNTGAVTATYTYDPSGKQLTAAGRSALLNPLRYTQGLLDDQSGWLRHGLRWYDTTTANWTAQDPLGQLLRPDAPSRYAYADSNPNNRIDPSGAGCGKDLLEYGGVAAFFTGTVEGAGVASGFSSVKSP
jgi:RHS repeat-associated protein